MKIRTIAATVALAATGSVLVTAPALAGGAAVARDTGLFRYDFPAEATARVHSVSTPAGRTTVTLTVTGLTPGRTYGAHAHVNACDPLDGMAAGPHWQYVPGPATSPDFANPENEVWLDVTTNADGNGTSKATLDFAFPSDRRPRSVIIHAKPTATGANDSGVAGPRLACLNVGF